jgi:GNAT superfamily N-acetyltransferase
MILTLARPEEAEEIARLVNSAYRGESSRAGWTTEADLLDDVRTEPEIIRNDMDPNRGKAILCLRESGQTEIIGCVYLSLIDEEDDLTCYLGMLTVKPTIQARGRGRFILEESEKFARNWGAVKITMNVISVRDTLIQWYQRRGYSLSGKTKAFHNHPELQFIILEKNLR